jgi:hypothetical protein
MRRVVSALAGGVGDVLRAPAVIALAGLVTLLSAAPFALVVGNQVREALADQPPIALGSGEIDGDWWSEFLVHARGLAATFTPAIIGFAAPLDNLSGVLDRTRRPAVLLVPVLIAMMAWSWLWGVALTRYHAGPGSLGRALAAGVSHWPRFFAISAGAAALQIVLYLTIHPLLFGVVFDNMISGATSEPVAFAIRVGLYLVFGVMIVAVSLVADYSRAFDVVERPGTLMALPGAAVRFVREQATAVATLYLATGLLFVTLFAAFGIVDIYGGSRVGGWRGIAIAQGYIFGRLVIRLTFGASELRLVKATAQSSRYER